MRTTWPFQISRRKESPASITKLRRASSGNNWLDCKIEVATFQSSPQNAKGKITQSEENRECSRYKAFGMDRSSEPAKPWRCSTPRGAARIRYQARMDVDRYSITPGHSSPRAALHSFPARNYSGCSADRQPHLPSL